MLVLLVVIPSCSLRQATPAAPAPVTRYLFSEQLPDATEVCVPVSAWDARPTCMPLGALRRQLRSLRYARAW